MRFNPDIIEKNDLPTAEAEIEIILREFDKPMSDGEAGKREWLDEFQAYTYRKSMSCGDAGLLQKLLHIINVLFEQYRLDSRQAQAVAEEPHF